MLHNINRGFIPQEVEKVFPQAIVQHTDFVPDVFAMSESTVLNGDNLTVTMKAPHQLANGNLVRVILEDGTTKEATVKITGNNSFVISNWDTPAKQIFVYGKQVNDFRTIDYQQIFATGISAIQELSKKIGALEAENNKLKTQTTTDHDLLMNIQARLETLENKDKTALK